MTPQDFIAKWGMPDGAPGPAYALNEEQGAQSHFLDLCEVLGVPKPGSAADYLFEEKGHIIGGRTGYADVFMRGVFAWENKAPGRNLDTALKQLLTYSLALSNPPLLVVSDRLVIRIHTQFTGHPSETHEVRIAEMDQPEKLALLRRIWTAPESFKPRITNRDITEAAAKSFSTLAEGLRRRGTRASDDSTTVQLRANQVAHFLTQCLFCFFAEDVNLLPGRMFERLVTNRHITPDKLTNGLRDLFTAMADGGMYGADDIPWFNGGLFKIIDVPTLSILDVTELRNAANLNWSAIDVSIFGTLFERGLDPAKRSQLGAHYTDPATILRIIVPVVQRPLLEHWEKTATGMSNLLSQSKQSKRATYSAGGRRFKATAGDAQFQKAAQLFLNWLEYLKSYRVLDPACGSGNFLFLGLKALKDIEHRSHLDAAAMGLDREADLVTGPHNVLGIELNEYAAELARVTVWIGELQWRMAHGYEFKTNPVLEPLDHIECRDALLAWQPADTGGARQAVEANWPKANAVVGNPPFLGGSKKRRELGDDYIRAIDSIYAPGVPGGSDLVCYWFAKALKAIKTNGLNAAGLVATNSIRGGTNRKVLQSITELSRIYAAWSDEGWVNEGAAVRVSLVCFGHGTGSELNGDQVPQIYADLTAPTTAGDLLDVSQAHTLSANLKASFQGASKKAKFEIDAKLARDWLCQPNPHNRPNSDVLKPWANGFELSRGPQHQWIIDFGLEMTEAESALFELPFSYATSVVKPERIKNNREAYRKFWWRFAEPRPGLRAAIKPLSRFIATVAHSKHRFFIWLPVTSSPDQALITVARADDTTIGILHSRFHELWSLRMGTSIGVGNDPRYTPTTCFETFPFPAGLTPSDTAGQCTEKIEGGALIPANLKDQPTKALASEIAQAAKRLNELRDNWLNPSEWTQRVPEVIPLGLSKSPYPDRIEPKAGISEVDLSALKKRTLTNLYNLRPDWLANAHSQLDAKVAAAYGWTDYTSAMSDEEILKRLLALNLERAKGSVLVPVFHQAGHK